MFVTWRLHGSLPRRQPLILGAGMAFVAMDRLLATASTGPRWLEDPRIAQVVFDALRYGQERLDLYELRAWVVMANHVHILIYPKAELPRITRAVKNYSAREANKTLGRSGLPFWKDESYDHWVRDDEELNKIVRYIEFNPVAAGLVTKPEEWRWSSGWAGQEACPTLEV